MKRNILINIQSVSDIITNSSTEVFILNNENDAVEELIKELLPGRADWVRIFQTEEDVKKYLFDNYGSYSEELNDLSEILDFNPLVALNDAWNFDPEKMTQYGFTKEKVIDFFFEPYKELIGKAILSFADDCYVPEDIWTFTNAAKKNNLVLEFFRS